MDTSVTDISGELQKQEPVVTLTPATFQVEDTPVIPVVNEPPVLQQEPVVTLTPPTFQIDDTPAIKQQTPIATPVPENLHEATLTKESKMDSDLQESDEITCARTRPFKDRQTKPQKRKFETSQSTPTTTTPVITTTQSTTVKRTPGPVKLKRSNVVAEVQPIVDTNNTTAPSSENSTNTSTTIPEIEQPQTTEQEQEEEEL